MEPVLVLDVLFAPILAHGFVDALLPTLLPVPRLVTLFVVPSKLLNKFMLAPILVAVLPVFDVLAVLVAPPTPPCCCMACRNRIDARIVSGFIICRINAGFCIICRAIGFC